MRKKTHLIVSVWAILALGVCEFEAAAGILDWCCPPGCGRHGCGHCDECSTYICCRPYNAFSPVSFGSMTYTGCCPGGGCGMGACCPCPSPMCQQACPQMPACPPYAYAPYPAMPYPAAPNPYAGYPTPFAAYSAPPPHYNPYAAGNPYAGMQAAPMQPMGGYQGYQAPMPSYGPPMGQYGAAMPQGAPAMMPCNYAVPSTNALWPSLPAYPMPAQRMDGRNTSGVMPAGYRSGQPQTPSWNPAQNVPYYYFPGAGR